MAKKKKLRYNDFVVAFNTLKLDVKQQENIFNKMKKAKDKWLKMIDISFLSNDYKERYKQLIQERFIRLS